METLLVKDVERALARQAPAQWRDTLGPFVLLQQPSAPVYHQVARLLGRGQTVGMAHSGRLGDEILSMLRGFQNLEVLSLVRLLDRDHLQVGRSDGCDVVIHEPSVSSVHARLRWDAGRQCCTVTDLGSRNGTFVNARLLSQSDLSLHDGDAIMFGDAPFLFLRPETLHQQLQSFALHRGG